MGHLLYLTGPVRSGKSRRAVELASAWGEQVVVVATFRSEGCDAEMRDRIQRHQAERPAWRVVEAPQDAGAALATLTPPPSGVVFDCLTLWLSDRLDQSDDAIRAAWDQQLQAFRGAPWPIVIVGNEVGWSLVPESPVLRRYRDLAGWLGQATAAASDEAWLMVSGCPLRLK
jgi:adenosylcobinamide kinase/adenosylcobinamide-phosphate guanylyltransferase